MRPVFLNIKKQWHALILSKIKREEYRSLTQYYASRILCKRHYELFCELEDAGLLDYLQHVNLEAKSDTVHLRNGYAKTDPESLHELTGVSVKEPNPDWCPSGTTGHWFALELGSVLEAKNLKP